MIRHIIEEKETKDRYIVCEAMAEYVENKYDGLDLQYQLKRMKIETTGKMLQAIPSLLKNHNQELKLIEVLKSYQDALRYKKEIAFIAISF